MTFTYTSAELAEIAGSIPTLADKAGLLFVPGAKFEGDNHVALSGGDLPAAEAVKVASHIGASFISVSATPFDLHRLVEELAGDEDELPESAKQIVKRAESHDGSVEGVTITWGAQGLVYVWHAQTEWIDKFLDDLASAQETAEAAEDAVREERMDEYRAVCQTAITALVESRKFRGELLGKRRLLVPAILEEAGIEELPEVFIANDVLRHANRTIAEKAYEFEQDFLTRKSELAAELQADPGWMRETTKHNRKKAAAAFLTKKADGYRLTNGELAAEISEMASVPRNWVTLTPKF